MEQIPPEILDAIQEVQTYFVDEDDWVVFKKELMKHTVPAARVGFSTRDQKTKKQSINSLEAAIISYWFQLTGVTLVIKP